MSTSPQQSSTCGLNTFAAPVVERQCGHTEHLQPAQLNSYPRATSPQQAEELEGSMLSTTLPFDDCRNAAALLPPPPEPVSRSPESQLIESSKCEVHYIRHNPYADVHRETPLAAPRNTTAPQTSGGPSSPAGVAGECTSRSHSLRVSVPAPDALQSSTIQSMPAFESSPLTTLSQGPQQQHHMQFSGSHESLPSTPPGAATMFSFDQYSCLMTRPLPIGAAAPACFDGSALMMRPGDESPGSISLGSGLDDLHALHRSFFPRNTPPSPFAFTHPNNNNYPNNTNTSNERTIDGYMSGGSSRRSSQQTTTSTGHVGVGGGEERAQHGTSIAPTPKMSQSCSSTSFSTAPPELRLPSSAPPMPPAINMSVKVGYRLPPTPPPGKRLAFPFKTMCCYFKQSGTCKMGDKCWYGHEGDLYTPCHYGAGCKAGHATLAEIAERNVRSY